MPTLEAKCEEVSALLGEQAQDEQGVLTWINLIRECADITELTRAIAYHLIDHIAVHEREEWDGITHQDIDVRYKFVGRIA